MLFFSVEHLSWAFFRLQSGLVSAVRRQSLEYFGVALEVPLFLTCVWACSLWVTRFSFLVCYLFIHLPVASWIWSMSVNIFDFAWPKNVFVYLLAWHSGCGILGQSRVIFCKWHADARSCKYQALGLLLLEITTDSRFGLQSTPRRRTPLSPKRPSCLNGSLASVISECSLHYLCVRCYVRRWCMRTIMSFLVLLR